MYQQPWGYKVEEKLYLGVREQRKVEYHWSRRMVDNVSLLQDGRSIHTFVGRGRKN
jgi:hypothetical protein